MIIINRGQALITTDTAQHRFTYTGHLAELYALWIFNAVLSFLTLGLYYFRAKTTFRKYLCEHFHLLGESWRYSGTALELCWGLIRGLCIFLVFAGIIFGIRQFLITEYAPNMQADYMPLPYFYTYVALDLLWLIIMHFFYSLARYGNLRYRLSRLQWKGIKFYMPGFSMNFVSLIFKCWIMKIISLGVLIPKMDLTLMRYYAERLYLGDKRLDLGSDKVPDQLFSTNLQTLLLFLPTLGLSRFWYQAALYQHLVQVFSLGPIKLACTFTAKNLMSLTLGNWAIIVLTLGIGFPITIKRKMDFIARHISLIGDEKTLKTLQINARTAPASEGLEMILGFGAGA